MANENELKELCDRIARLGGRDQTRLLEMVLAENRRQYEELAAQALAADAVLREAMKQELAAVEEWHTAQQQLKGLSGEAKREAG
jgi:hypothetical protein